MHRAVANGQNETFNFQKEFGKKKFPPKKFTNKQLKQFIVKHKSWNKIILILKNKNT